jgi:hypothetical protein
MPSRPDQPHLERHAPFGDTHQGDQAIVWKIDVAQRVSGLAQHLADRDGDRIEQRQDLRQLLRRQCGQQQVTVVFGNRRRCGKIHRILA